VTEEVVIQGVPGPEQVPVPSKGTLGRLLSNADFRNLFTGTTIDGIGDWLVVGLLIPIVGDLSNNSSMAIAGIMIAKIIPSLLLAGVIGALVDRFDRRRLIIACLLVNSVLCLGFIATRNLFVIYAVILLMEIANLMLVPARSALVPLLVEDRDLAAANAAVYTTQQACMLIGLVGAGAIVAVWVGAVRWVMGAGIWVISEATRSAPALVGPRAGVVLDSISFLVSALFISFITIRTTEKHVRAFDIRMIGHEVVEAFAILREEHELRGFLITMALGILGGGAIIPVGMTYVQENLVGGVPFLDQIQGVARLAAQSPQTFILVFLALGTATGAITVPRFAARFRLQQLFVACVAGFGAAMLGFSSVGVYWVAAVFAVCAGYALAGVTVAGNTYVSQAVPDKKRGRVFTALESVTRVAMLLSMIVVAPLGDLLGNVVRNWALANHVLPATLTITGSRITLWLASAIVLSAAVYASIAIDWRTARGDELGQAGQAVAPETSGAPDA
jgi:dTMP kinase